MVIRTDITGARRRRRLEPAQMAFGLLALALHLALLWAPLNLDLHRPVIRSGSVIEVSLARPPDEAMEAPTPETSAPPTAAPRQTEPPRLEPVKDEPIVATALPDASSLREAVPGQVAEIVRRSDAKAATPGLRRLHGSWDPAWSAPVLERSETVFTPFFAPSEAVILDQWQEPGGARRVVMRLPTGDTVCGRAEPWDPLNPLVEPVPMFHRCARRR